MKVLKKLAWLPMATLALIVAAICICFKAIAGLACELADSVSDVIVGVLPEDAVRSIEKHMYM